MGNLKVETSYMDQNDLCKLMHTCNSNSRDRLWMFCKDPPPDSWSAIDPNNQV